MRPPQTIQHIPSHDRPEEIGSVLEIAAVGTTRAVEAAAVLLAVLLVCPPLMILAVVVIVPLAALGVLVAIATLPYWLFRHLSGHRARHTSFWIRGFRRLRPRSA